MEIPPSLFPHTKSRKNHLSMAGNAKKEGSGTVLYRSLPCLVLYGTMIRRIKRYRSARALVDLRIKCIEVFAVLGLKCLAQSFAKTLEVHNLTLAQETDWVGDLRFLDEAQDIVIGQACLLFGGHILIQIGDGVTGGLEGLCREWLAARGHRPDGKCVVDVVFIETGRFDLLRSKVFGELTDDGGNDLEVAEFIRTLMLDITSVKKYLG